MTHVVVPEAIDDPMQPSGGNTYDRRVMAGLAGRGDRPVRTHVVAGSWPNADAAARRALRRTLFSLPAGSVVVIDGLIASAAGDIVEKQSTRVRVLALMHLPLGAAPGAGTEVIALERRALRAANAVIATSAWTRQWLIDRYALPPQVVQVAEPGVDRSAVTHGTPNGGRLLCVGAVARHKGQDVLVDALSRIGDRTWDCQLIGPIVDRNFADDLVRRTKTGTLRGRHAGGDPARCWSDRVTMVGPLPETALASVYARSDLLVVPSRLETYGMVVSEALARGLPVVATDVGGLPHALGWASTGVRPGLLVPPDDADALATVLASWLDDDVLRQRLRAAARERRTQLRGWPETVDRIALIVAQVAA